MSGKRRLRGHKGFQIVFAVAASASANRGPFRIGAGLGLLRSRLSGGAVIGKYVVEVGIEPRLDRLTTFQPIVHPIGGGGFFLPGRGRFGDRFAVVADRIVLNRTFQ